MPQHVIPVLRYRDAGAAIDFLERAFGLERALVVDGPGETVAHAELRWGDGMVMLGSVREGGEYDRLARPTGQAAVYVVVEDTDAHHDRAQAAGAEIVMELMDTPYGSRDYAARDPEGNVWSFGTYAGS